MKIRVVKLFYMTLPILSCGFSSIGHAETLRKETAFCSSNHTSVDLSIDSDNNDKFYKPTGKFEEDQIEDVKGDPNNPGKLIVVNDGDIDGDGVPNFADGFDKYGNEGSNAGGKFTPLVLEIREPIDLSTARIKFIYSDSDPNGVFPTNVPANNDPIIYVPAEEGNLRIWTVDGSAARKKAEIGSAGGGHFVKSGSEYKPSDFGLNSTKRSVDLFIEGIKESEVSEKFVNERIVIQLAYDVADECADADAVRCKLLKVNLMDVNSAEVDDDVVITSWNTSNNIRKNNIAWIDSHASDTDPAPRMPQLELKVSGLPDGITFEAKLKVQYQRGNGSRGEDGNIDRNQDEDEVQIPNSGEFSQIVRSEWKVYDEINWGGELDTNGFFGGDATLTYQIKLDEKVLLGPENINFRIGGENPDDVRCRAYIESRPNAGAEGNLWFGYAVAKSESKDSNGSGSRYNQFLALPNHRRDVGRPLWGNDGGTLPGGYGMFQVTGTVADSHADIPRKEIWNWQENVKAGLVILANKRSQADAWMERQKNEDNANGTVLPDHTVGVVTFAEETNRTMNDAVTIKLFNGASRPPAEFTDEGNVPGFLLYPQGSGHYCYWRNASNQWALNRFNNPPAPLQPFNYVSRVCTEVEN